MNAVGIDVSKGKSMMMALQPMNQVVLKPREYPHTVVGLEQMAHAILRLGEDTRVIMEATGRYHEPVAAPSEKSRRTRRMPERSPNMGLTIGRICGNIHPWKQSESN